MCIVETRVSNCCTVFYIQHHAAREVDLIQFAACVVERRVLLFPPKSVYNSQQMNFAV